MKFPLNFSVQAQAKEKVDTPWECKASSLPPILCSIPPEFGGPGRGYSPEDLFALALINCVIATFKVYAEKSSITYEKIFVEADLTVDKNPSENFLMMSHIDIKINISGTQDTEKTKTVLDKAIKECAIGNSIKTGKSFQINIS